MAENVDLQVPRELLFRAVFALTGDDVGDELRAAVAGEINDILGRDLAEDGQQAWLTELAKTCRSCQGCWEVPCGGCQGGGVCDDHCHCGQRDGIEREVEPADEDDDG
jgi:hypothetical protein